LRAYFIVLGLQS